MTRLQELEKQYSVSFFERQSPSYIPPTREEVNEMGSLQFPDILEFSSSDFWKYREWEKRGQALI